ncbi:Bro-N domain-containing protein [Nanoarchaeota archaeon]
MTKENKLIVFEDKKIRRIWFNDEWWFSVVDIIEALTESNRAKKYWSDLKKKLINEGFEPSEKIGQLKLVADDGKLRLTDCTNTKNAFRLIQSIPSKRAEPFKQWLAQVGYDRIEEIENPELAQKRMKEIYSAKGYPKDWIDKRLRGIAVRQNLTDEWEKRGIETQKDFAILTAEISKATFGLTPTEYKKHKNLPKKSKDNLRDHMNDLELIFTMLGERVTTELSEDKKPDSFNKSKEIAKKGGKAAGDARESTEKQLGRTIISKGNYLEDNKKKKLQ